MFAQHEQSHPQRRVRLQVVWCQGLCRIGEPTIHFATATITFLLIVHKAVVPPDAAQSPAALRHAPHAHASLREPEYVAVESQFTRRLRSFFKRQFHKPPVLFEVRAESLEVDQKRWGQHSLGAQAFGPLVRRYAQQLGLARAVAQQQEIASASDVKRIGPH